MTLDFQTVDGKYFASGKRQRQAALVASYWPPAPPDSMLSVEDMIVEGGAFDRRKFRKCRSRCLSNIESGGEGEAG